VNRDRRVKPGDDVCGGADLIAVIARPDRAIQ
jgi:hypothetical protein